MPKKTKNSQINRLQGASVTNGAVDDHPGPPVAQRQARHPLSEQRDPAGARTVDDKDAAPSFLFEHAVQGCCPPLPILQRLGFRTSCEIETERYELKTLRGDFGPTGRRNFPLARASKASWRVAGQ